MCRQVERLDTNFHCLGERTSEVGLAYPVLAEQEHWDRVDTFDAA